VKTKKKKSFAQLKKAFNAIKNEIVADMTPEEQEIYWEYKSQEFSDFFLKGGKQWT